MEEQILNVLTENLDSLNPEIKKFIVEFLSKIINKFDTANYYIFYKNENKYYLVKNDKKNTNIDVKNPDIAVVTDLTEYINLAKKIIKNIHSN